MRKFRKAISVILAVLMLIATAPLQGLLGVDFSNIFSPEANAAEMEIEAITDYIFTPSDDDKIMYTDLFYAYPTYLKQDPYLPVYHSNISTAYTSVYNAYKTSPLVIGSAVEFVFDNIVSPTDIAKLITDGLQLSDFSYNESLDMANELIVDKLLEGVASHDIEDGYGKVASVTKKMKKIVEYFDALELESDDGHLKYDAKYYLQESFDYLHDSGIISAIPEELLAQLYVEINDEEFNINSYFKLATTEISIARGIVTAIMLEDTRLDIMSWLAKAAPSKSVLADGMSRLNSKMQNGFVGNFVKNYFSGAVADKLCSVIDDAVVSVLGLKGITSLIEIANTVIFDFLIKVPSYDQLITLQVLKCYENDMQTALANLADAFNSELFLSDKILQYESAFYVYEAICGGIIENLQQIADMVDPYEDVYKLFQDAKNANIKQVQITIIENGVKVSLYLDSGLSREEVVSYFDDRLLQLMDVIIINNGLQSKNVSTRAIACFCAMAKGIETAQTYIQQIDEDENIYANHIKNVFDLIYSTPAANREFIPASVYKNRTISIGSGVSILPGSNEVKPGVYYTVKGTLFANAHITNYSMNYPGTLIIAGDCSVGHWDTLTISKNTKFAVCGEFWGHAWAYSSGYHAVIINNGCMVMAGTSVGYAELKGSGRYVLNNISVTEYIFQETNLQITGTCTNGTALNISNCNVAITGTEYQNIILSGTAKNLDVYSSDLSLTPCTISGSVDFHGNNVTVNSPIVLINSAVAEEGSNYKHILMKDGYYLYNSIAADKIEINRNLYVYGLNCTLRGNVRGSSSLSYGIYVPSGKTLNIVGDLYGEKNFIYSSEIESDGNCTITGIVSGYIICSGTGAIGVNDINATEFTANDVTLQVNGNVLNGIALSMNSASAVFSGSHAQNVTLSGTVKNLDVYSSNLTLTPCSVSESVDFHGNDVSVKAPIILTNSAVAEEGSNYKHIRMLDGYYLYNNIVSDVIEIKRNLYISSGNRTLTGLVKGTDSLSYGISISSGASLTVDGDIYGDKNFIYSSEIYANGKFKVTGKTSGYLYFCYSGTFELNDVDLSETGMEGGKWFISGNVNNLPFIEAATVTFCGNEPQKISASGTFGVCEITNHTGVTFSNKVTSTKLFNHNLNPFTLKSGGSFVDYDGDGLKDNVDPLPKIAAYFNSYVLNDLDVSVALVSGSTLEDSYWEIYDVADETEIVIPSSIGNIPVKSFDNAFEGNTQVETVVVYPSFYDVSDIELSDSVLTIKGYSGTNAEKLATENNLEFQSVGTVTSIEIATPADKTEFSKIQSFSSEGLTLNVYTDDGKCYQTDAYDISGYDSSVGAKTITVTYAGKTAAYEVWVSEYSFDYISDNTLSITGYYGNETSIEIPADINGKTVTKIASISNSIVEEIAVPATVLSVSNSAFSNATSLVSITVDSANKNYSSVDGILYNYSKTTLVRYPSAKPGAEFTIPASVTEVASNAMRNCDNITELTVHEAVTDLGSYAFGYCDNLKVVNYNAISCTTPSSSVLMTNTPFSNCKTLETVNIGDNVIAIPRYLFYKNTGIKELIISEDSALTTIAQRAFSGCSSLGEITLSHKISSIGSNAFANCSSLSINCYNRTAAYDYAVANNIPYTVIDAPLTEIDMPEETNVTKGFTGEISEFYELVPWYSSEEVVWTSSNPSVITITDGILTAPACGKSIVTVTSDSGKTASCLVCVVSIDGAEYSDFDYTLANDNTTITIIDYVGDEKNVIIPSEIGGLPVTQINSTFSGCDFESITIGENVTSVAATAFNGVYTLQNIYVDSANTSFVSVDGVLYNSSGTKLVKYPSGKKDEAFVIPDTVHTIGSHAFHAAQFSTIKIPENVSSIGTNAFNGCDKLITAYYNAAYCTSPVSSSRFIFKDTIQTVIIGENVTYLPAYFLLDCPVEEIVVPASVTSINKNALVGCENVAVKAYANSCAKEYAESSGFAFEALVCGDCTFEVLQIVTEATCTEEGTQVCICSICGYEIETAIEKKEHSYPDEWIVSVSPTCTSDGIELRNCTGCNAATETRTMVMYGHDFEDKWTTDTEATCSSEGSKSHHCTRCEAKKDVTVTDKIPHSYKLTVTAQTCTANGYTTYTCICGDTYVSDYTDKLSHTDADGDCLCDFCHSEITPETDEDNVLKCSHICHQTGFMGFIWKVINFFQMLFGVNPVCECGVAHY